MHGDYWPGNTISHSGQLIGIVDWEEPRRGDPLQDVGGCRLDLTLLAGPEAADLSLLAYEAAVDPVSHLFFWELHVALMGRSPTCANGWPATGIWATPTSRSKR